MEIDHFKRIAKIDPAAAALALAQATAQAVATLMISMGERPSQAFVEALRNTGLSMPAAAQKAA